MAEPQVISHAEDLDARVDEMLRKMDEVHAKVVARLDGNSEPEQKALDAALTEALAKAAEAVAAVPPDASGKHPVVNPPALAGAAAPEVTPPPSAPAAPRPTAPVSAQPDLTAPAAPVDEPHVPQAPPAPIAAPASVPSAAMPEPATLAQLDEHLAEQAASAAMVDDEFADGGALLEAAQQSLEVPLPAASPAPQPTIEPNQAPGPAATLPVAEPPIPEPPAQPEEMVDVLPDPLPEAAPAAPEVCTPAAAMPPLTASAAAPAVAVAPPPVATPAPAVRTPPPAPRPAPPTAKPAAALKPAPAAAPWTDHLWRVVTPVVEPLAVRMARLPLTYRQTVGWIGLTTAFVSSMVWGYVFFFQETRPPSHVAAAERAKHAAHAEGAESGHEEPKHAAPEQPSEEGHGGH